MQAKKRYLLVFISCAFIAYFYFGNWQQQGARGGGYRDSNDIDMEANMPEFATPDTQQTGSLGTRRARRSNGGNMSLCRMETCFDMSRCRKSFKVYVYPLDEDRLVGEPSPSYRKLLNVLIESRYYTTDAAEACLFVLSIDTLDRDRLSADYVRHLGMLVQRLPHWNNGLNHVIFNLYSGTWPDYTEHGLDFNYGRAILAKASMSVEHLRPGFDVSIPLFHKTHPEKGGDLSAASLANRFPAKKNYLLAFKGKRYVHGIGSETRNSLYHLHDSHEVILVTTCRHGKSWKDMKDERCDADNREYERYDYEVLLQNATFCLVPRGRRLGSFRFLEALQAGCIPVLLSNSWALPFNEVIDWSQAVIWADERLLLQVPNIVRSISATRILKLRQQTQVLWDRYLSSIEKIVYTTLEIIRERLPREPQRDGSVWNRYPGALLTLPKYADNPLAFPFMLDQTTVPLRPPATANSTASSTTNDTTGQFTAVIYCQLGAPVTLQSALYRLVSNVVHSRHVRRVVIEWSNDKRPPGSDRWNALPVKHVPIHVLQSMQQQQASGGGAASGASYTNGTAAAAAAVSAVRSSISQRFFPHPLIDTAAVLSLDEDTTLTTDEIDFAFNVWRAFPDRIVGYPARSHYWDDAKASWGYTSKWTNDYSIVLTGAAFYHRYYNHLYTDWLPPLLHKTVDQSQNCEDILMNFLVSHVTRRPPIKVTQRKQYKDTTSASQQQQLSVAAAAAAVAAGAANVAPSPWNDPDHFIQRQTCLNTFAAVFGYMPLVRSNLRLDPVLFKDPVSNLRKKYRQIELVGS